MTAPAAKDCPGYLPRLSPSNPRPKQLNPTPAISLNSIRHVLLDIEGTTCSVKFVSEVLFPYATERLQKFLDEHASDPIVAALLQQVDQAWEQDTDPTAQALRVSATKNTNQPNPTQAAEGGTPPVESGPPARVAPYLVWLIKTDRKLAPLKELQGLIWEDGYRNGALQGPLYEDVAPALQRWREAGLGLAVYSSGSVRAQQLLYQYSSAGDLRNLFSQWFDTRIGPKYEPASYKLICDQLASPCSQVLFISDSFGELQAARSAGLTILCSDRGESPHLQHNLADVAIINSFSSIHFPPQAQTHHPHK